MTPPPLLELSHDNLLAVTLCSRLVCSSGILKDYLRELPSQLITRTLYQVVREAMILRPPPAGPDPQLARSTVGLLSCLPPPERVTLQQSSRDPN